jgi:peptidoglycan-associated lipoprotein
MKQPPTNLLLASAIAFALVGCASKKPAGTDGAAIEERGPVAGAPATAGDSRTGASGKDDVVSRSFGDDGSSADISGTPAARQIFFDLDQYTIKPEYQGVVQATADFLKGKPKVRVVVQGNTDERGSSEYNLSLGQKRAEAVRKALGVLGVADDRIEAVSLGEEKPMSECHNESCWSKNRRADIVYQAR